jgi:hypothetical protein
MASRSASTADRRPLGGQPAEHRGLHAAAKAPSPVPGGHRRLLLERGVPEARVEEDLGEPGDLLAGLIDGDHGPEHDVLAPEVGFLLADPFRGPLRAELERDVALGRIVDGVASPRVGLQGFPGYRAGPLLQAGSPGEQGPASWPDRHRRRRAGSTAVPIPWRRRYG